MKINTKQIAYMAMLFVICLISQYFKNLSVYITGPIINACLFIAAVNLGILYGIILAVVTPISSFLIAGSPIMSAIPAIIPMIMIGNTILVVVTGLYKTIFKGKTFLSMIVASVLKSLFMGIFISLIILPSFLPEAMQKSKLVLQFTFSISQLITAIMGSVLAILVIKVLKKAPQISK